MAVASMLVVNVGPSDDGEKVAAEDLDDRTRHQYKVVLQFLQEKQLFETLAQFESETGVTFNERHLPVAGMLEACLDMFGGYCNSETVATQSEQDKVGNEAEE
ncbi:unnamed protein product, partial [Polarella glacialis]